MFVLNYTGDGGTEKYVLNLISALGKDKCVFVYSEKGPFFDKFKTLGMPIYQVSMKSPFDYSAAKQIKKICLAEGVTYIHAQFLRENYIALLSSVLGSKARVIWTYHVNVPMPSYIKFSNSLMCRLNHKVIAVAEFMKIELLQKGVPEEKIKVIYNGIRDPYRGHTRPKVTNEKIISVVGRLSPEKGHQYLFNCLAKVKKERPDLLWKLNIVGDGGLKQELNALAINLGIDDNVVFKGFVNDMQSEYENSDIIVMPSQNEAFPFVAIEALANQKPVISTNVGGLPEIIRHNETGLLTTYGDVHSLSESIIKLLEDETLANNLAENGREYFLQTLTFDEMLNKTLSVYNLSRETIKINN
ncbi:glycosyltransferase family 4 protein [Bacillus marasmi]|uniref:glycosyltransferase family 4 protein n=1 Tax=Bacillus marasmi TaxID=1926279 RepID=UPI001FE7C2B0|nr:glycosyltransferase family 4 protein [Bacillus marasmi]